jgi:hypothetical protein
MSEDAQDGTCARCRFWWYFYSNQQGRKMGQCRVNPPVFYGTTSSVDPRPQSAPDCWPTSWDDSWCGQFRAKG